MNTSKSQTRITGAVLTVMLLLGIGFSAASTASAQRNKWDGYPNLGGSYQLRETALNAGYNEGQKEGSRDASSNRCRSYSDFSSYRNGTKDYNGRLGNRDIYRQYFQAGFESGYNTAIGVRNTRREDGTPCNNRPNNGNYNVNPNYNNNPNYGNNNNNYGNNNHPRGLGRDWSRYGNYGNASYQLRETALNAGYNEGRKQGQRDRGRNRWQDPNSFGSYQNATTDYSNRLGDRELYRRYYREGFQNGYADGWNGY